MTRMSGLLAAPLLILLVQAFSVSASARHETTSRLLFNSNEAGRKPATPDVLGRRLLEEGIAGAVGTAEAILEDSDIPADEQDAEQPVETLSGDEPDVEEPPVVSEEQDVDISVDDDIIEVAGDSEPEDELLYTELELNVAASNYVHNESLVEGYNNEYGQELLAENWRNAKHAFAVWVATGYAKTDYKFGGFGAKDFDTGTLNGKKLYICHVDDIHKRPIGVTWVEGSGQATAFRNCYYSWKDPATGAVSVGTKSGTIAGWAVLQDYRLAGVSFYTWAPVASIVSQCYWLKQTGNRPAGTICPRVIGNYAESRSTVGFAPDRQVCRWQEGSETYIGYSDIRDARMGKTDPTCYAFKFVGGQRVPHTRSSNYQILVFRHNNVEQQVTGNGGMACDGTCRGEMNYPRSDWPGVIGRDIVEGAMYYAKDAASCCNACQNTPGCMGWKYYVKAQRWCWLKHARCNEGGKCYSPAAPKSSECAAKFPEGEYIGSLIPAEKVKPVSTGQCRVAQILDGVDLGHCGLPMATRTTSLEGCCQECQNFNAYMRKWGDSMRCTAWTWIKGYNFCYIRSRIDCNGSHGWKSPGTTVSAIMDKNALYPGNQ